jgi:acyl-CoA thioesterase-1
MYDVLKFCYLSLCFLLISCAGNDAKKTDDQKKVESVKVEAQPQSSEKTILFFGNSLTAGMGLDVEEAFPALIQRKIDSASLTFNVINAGLSGETTASGKNRLAWLLKQKVDVFVLELGANDGLRGIPLAETKKNLQNIIDEVKGHNSEVIIVLAGMQIPPNMGLEYTKGFRNIFPDLAAENKLALIPFLLMDVAGNPDLNQADGIHPTAEGQIIVANNVWEILKTAL